MKNLVKGAVLLLLLIPGIAITGTAQVLKSNTPKLYIKTTTTKGEGGNQVFTSTTTTVESEIFEVSLGVMGVGLANYYYGSKVIDDGKYFNIVENDSIVTFNGSGEFIKYMSARGYKMVSETRGEFANSYVFKRE